MKYYIYDAEAGYEEIEDLKEVAKKFLETEYSLGIWYLNLQKVQQ
ncbi:MAG: hypothetical protein N4A76_03950 [Firmicutes bacterium]|jgi:hypothetical protein|nr:hypothetical protein [Bacillota bacterium]